MAAWCVVPPAAMSWWSMVPLGSVACRLAGTCPWNSWSHRPWNGWVRILVLRRGCLVAFPAGPG